MTVDISVLRRGFQNICKGLRSFRRIGRIGLQMANNNPGTSTIMPVAPLVAAFRQALCTFKQETFRDTSVNFQNNLTKLKSMMDNLKADDLGFDPNFNDPAVWKEPGKAPCTYIEVFQNSDVNLSMFILKPGFKMPLHDHPHMYGLLKLISGAVRLKSYSKYPLTDEVSKSVQVKSHSAVGRNNKFLAEITSDEVCSAISPTCVLTPTKSNFHEIEALEFPAAFFDVLAPPYETYLKAVGPRLCRYYKINNEISTNLVEMQEIRVPDSFYCDQAPYLGPLLM